MDLALPPMLMDSLKTAFGILATQHPFGRPCLSRQLQRVESQNNFYLGWYQNGSEGEGHRYQERRLENRD